MKKTLTWVELDISSWVKTKKNEKRKLIWKEKGEIVRREMNEKKTQKNKQTEWKKKTNYKMERWHKERKKTQAIICGGCGWKRKQLLKVKRNRRKGEWRQKWKMKLNVKLKRWNGKKR